MRGSARCCLFLFSATLIVLVSSGCERRQTVSDSRALAALSDFTMVGTAQYEPSKVSNEEVNKTVASHGLDPLSVNIPVETRKQYIFHHRRPLDTEKLALMDLPAKLRGQGLQILSAPQSPRDMAYSFVGGPIFTIKFREGNHIGFIFSQVCPSFTKQVDSGWVGNDYVLVYIK